MIKHNQVKEAYDILEKIWKNREVEEAQVDKVNSPEHYIGLYGLEVEEILQQFVPRYEDSYVGHRVGSAIEYLLRSPLKNGIEDLRKAIKNIELAIEYLEEGDSE